MKIIAVDDEEMIVEYLRRLIGQVRPDAQFVGFTQAEDAFKYLSGSAADIALLDIEMGENNGIELAKKCKDLCPKLNVIFVTGYSDYSMEAFKVHASGYLLKPVRADDLRAELENLRNPPLRPTKRVRIQTFGDFEVFVDRRPVKFPRTKCKECLAYLIDRKGARVTYPALSAVLWEDKPSGYTLQNNTQKIVSDMMKALKEVNAENIIIKSRLDIAIDTTQVDCDYYAALAGDTTQLNAFTGEYMSNYSWAEFTLGELCRVLQS